MARGSFPLGPESGWLRLHVFREGVVSALGHDLVLEAESWSGTLAGDPEHPGEVEVTVSVPISSLFVREAQGGLRKLTPQDKESIRDRIATTLRGHEHPTLQFSARGAQLQGVRDGGGFGKGTLAGSLAVAGRSEPLEVRFTFTRQGEDVRISGGAEVVQTRWGVTPFKGLHFGLRVRDSVEVYFDLLLTGGGAVNWEGGADAVGQG
ncbi:MAG: hypothetical protein GEV12_00540 [Micromonosporaceae bacterium]|nr:hypothetical protein [Micromonosporaceae bacterium]